MTRLHQPKRRLRFHYQQQRTTTNAMEFDPSSRDGPPPRHAIESDSEASDDKNPSSKKSFQAPRVAITPQGNALPPPPGLPLTLLLGEMGEAYVRATRMATGVLQYIEVDDKIQGALTYDQSQPSAITALVRLDAKLASQPSSFAYVAAEILAQIKPCSLTVVDEYFTVLYNYGEDVDPDRMIDQSPIRVLCGPTNPTNPITKPFAAFAPPNYLTGLVASVVSEALVLDIPFSVLLLPQGKSFNPHLQSLHTVAQASDALQARPDELNAELTQELNQYLKLTSSSLKQTQEERLDEFLQRRRTEARKSQRQTVSSMYM